MVLSFEQFQAAQWFERHSLMIEHSKVMSSR
jgi:hypothetical protein